MTEIVVPDNNIDVLPPARPMASHAIQQLMEHAQAMSAAKQFGTALAATDMVPKDYKGNPANAAAAILYGAELGLSPIQSLQQIFVVHGSPAIYARTAVALVMRHGVTVETVSSTNEAVTVRAVRDGRVEECTWDAARATTAGYGSNKKYQTDPQAMLYAKAAMECCRKIAPDVLLGIAYAREELEMEPAPKRVHAERARGVAALAQRVAEPMPEDAPVPMPVAEYTAKKLEENRQRWLNRMFALLADGDCTDRDDQLIVLSYLAGRHTEDMLEHRDQLTDKELRDVVTMLHAYNKAGELGGTITEILNTHTLTTETGTAATTPEEA